jgi:hypothetical protein
MKLKANRKNLTKHARQLLGVEYTPEKERELVRVVLTGFERTHGHISHDYSAHLEKLDAILGTHGVEGMLEPDILYCNTGDTYTMTLLYHDGELWIGDWGSIVEES